MLSLCVRPWIPTFPPPPFVVDSRMCLSVNHASPCSCSPAFPVHSLAFVVRSAARSLCDPFLLYPKPNLKINPRPTPNVVRNPSLANTHPSLIPYPGTTWPNVKPRVVPHGIPVGSGTNAPRAFAVGWRSMCLPFVTPYVHSQCVPLCVSTFLFLCVTLIFPFFQHSPKKEMRSLFPIINLFGQVAQ